MAGCGLLRVKNLGKYQHYTNRNPPWIKLHSEILTSYDFGHLPDQTKWHALAILLLASKMDNEIPNDPKWIRDRTQSTTTPNVRELIDIGFLEHVASTVLAECKQKCVTEERRGETEGEGETLSRGGASAPLAPVVGKGENGEEPKKNGDVPDNWREVNSYLSHSEVLNNKQLRDWPWWDKIDQIHQDDNIDLLREFAKMEEYFARKPIRARQIKDWRRFVKNWLTTAAEGGS